MGNVVEKMGNHVPKGFLGFNIGLSAVLAVFALNNCSAV